VTPAAVWRNVSIGVLFLAVGVIVYRDAPWQWIFVVFAGLSLVNAVVKGRWRWTPHPLLWGLGLGWAYATGMNAWAMFWWLLGGSVFLGFLVSLIPSRPPPRPGEGVVIDAEVTDRGRS
jgi:hypothetical protein